MRGARTEGDDHAERHGPGEEDQGRDRAVLIASKDDNRRRRRKKTVHICLFMKPTKLKKEKCSEMK